MASDAIEVPAIVIADYRGDRHLCEATIGGAVVRVLARRCGRLVLNHIRVCEGDRVTVEVNGYDPSRGRILRRH